MPDIYMIGVVIVLALCFDFINGFHDTANAIATCVATRALSPRVAIIMSAILNFVGAMISTGVAKTIGGEIVTSPHMVDSVVLAAALASSILWNLFTENRDAFELLSCTDRRRYRRSHHFLRNGCHSSGRRSDYRSWPRLLACSSTCHGLHLNDSSIPCFPQRRQVQSQLCLHPYSDPFCRTYGIFPWFQ